MWSEMIRATGEPLIGLETAKRLPEKYPRAVWRVFRSQPTLRAAWSVARKALEVARSDARASVQVERDDCTLQMALWDNRRAIHTADVLLGLAVRWSRLLLPHFALTSVSVLNRDEEYRSRYEAFFRTKVVMGADIASFTFPTEFLDRPIGIPAPPVCPGTADLLDRKFANARSTNPLVDLESGYKEFVDTGKGCQDSLARRAQALGVPARALMDNARRAACVRLVATTSETIEAIAAKTGFSHRSSFQRAFRRWTGHGPAQFRRLFASA